MDVVVDGVVSVALASKHSKVVHLFFLEKIIMISIQMFPSCFLCNSR